jgi:regulator of RNase E activity RraA
LCRINRAALAIVTAADERADAVGMVPRLTEADLIHLRRRLRAALVCDALDTVGLRRQSLGADIQWLSGKGVLVGHALTVSTEVVEVVPDDPYVGLTAALDALTRGDVYVMATGRSDKYAAWGELVSIAAAESGAVGMVTDGLVRDAAQVERLGFPVLARGTTAVDINGRAEVIGHGSPIMIDGVEIEAGDLIVADRDGVVIVPTAVRDDVISLATSKGLAERRFRKALATGMSASEAFARFHVL